MKSNEALLIVRQNIIKLYKQYEYIILPIFKLIMALIGIQALTSSIGYSGVLNKMPILLILVLLTTFFSEKWIIVGIVFIIPLYFIELNPILALVLFVFLLVLYLLFMRLFPRESLLIIITLICYKMGIEIFVPIIAALFGSYLGVIPIIIGVFIWFVMPEITIIFNAGNDGKIEIIESFSGLMSTGLKSILMNQTMLCSIVVFFIVYSIVHIIRKQPIDYASYIATSIGGAMNLAGFGLAALFLNMNTNMFYILVMTVIGVLIADVFQFFSKVLDYQRSEIVSFEDEDNYYYVKVVPKIEVSATHKKIKTVYNAKTEGQNTMSDIFK